MEHSSRLRLTSCVDNTSLLLLGAKFVFVEVPGQAPQINLAFPNSARPKVLKDMASAASVEEWTMTTLGQGTTRFVQRDIRAANTDACDLRIGR